MRLLLFLLGEEVYSRMVDRRAVFIQNVMQREAYRVLPLPYYCTILARYFGYHLYRAGK